MFVVDLGEQLKVHQGYLVQSNLWKTVTKGRDRF